MTQTSHSDTLVVTVVRAGSLASYAGPSEWFTGIVRVDPMFAAPPPARVSGALVTFEPGARIDWHTHPAGQILVVMSGCGRVQQEGHRGIEIMLRCNPSIGCQKAVIRQEPQLAEAVWKRTRPDSMPNSCVGDDHNDLTCLSLSHFFA